MLGLALSLPDRLPVLLLACGLAGLGAVLVGQFRPLVVLPTVVLLVAGTWRLVPAAPPTTWPHVGALFGVLLLCAGWVVVGLRSVAAFVVVNRDPGFLTLQALWLVRHPSAPIPVGSAEVAATAVSGASAATEAFSLHDGFLYAQGNKMLPSLLAMQGWLGGERAVLAGNLTIGVVAIVAVFALARRLAGPLWALVPTTAMALCLPMLVFTRAAYTEPLTVAFLCGGLVVVHGATVGTGRTERHTTARPRRAVPAAARWALAGALIGAVGAARIDGAVALAGLAVGCALIGATPLGRSDRRAAVRAVLAALVAGTAMVGLGMVDVLRLSPDYARQHREQLSSLLPATAAVVVLAVAVLLLPAGALASSQRVLHRHRNALGRASAAAVLCVGVALATRPLWWQGRYIDPDTGFGYAVTVLQAAAGLSLDASRSYDEQTLGWVSWYLGTPAVVLGLVGLAVLAHRAVARRDPAATVFVAVVAVAGFFPLVRVSITPDQIWAVRRLVPATFPGLLVGAACALAAFAGRRGSGLVPDRSSPVRRAGPRRAWVRVWDAELGARRAVAGALGVLVAVAPVSTWGSVAGVVELSGRDTQAHAVCDALAATGAEKVVWVHSSPFRYLATLRVMCDVEVVEVLTPPTVTDLAAIRAAWGGGTVAAASFDVADLPWSQAPSDSVGGTLSTTLGRTLTGPPTTVDSTWSEVWIGLVQDDGAVVPVG